MCRHQENTSALIAVLDTGHCRSDAQVFFFVVDNDCLGLCVAADEIVALAKIVKVKNIAVVLSRLCRFILSPWDAR